MAVPFFLGTASAAQAACIYDDQALTITCEAGPMDSGIHLGPNGDGYSIIVNPSARVSGGGRNAISVGSGTDIEIYGLVDNNARDEPGEYGERANTIEGDSLNTITIRSGGEVLAGGTNTEAAAIKMMGHENEINNSGAINSDRGVAVWFRNIGVDGTEERNRLTNEGTISTSSSAGVAIRNDDGLGLIFENSGTINGAISLGNGDDSLTFLDGSTITGDVSAGGGQNNLTFLRGSNLTGNITTGDGNDIFTFNHEATASGNINAGGGQDTLILINGIDGSEPQYDRDELAGNLTGVSDIIKQGLGSWTLKGSLSGTQNVTVEGGNLTMFGGATDFYGQAVIKDSAILSANVETLPVRADGSSPTQPQIIIENGGALYVSQEGEATYSGLITGDGRVLKTGAGTLLLEGSNTYTGGTTIYQGTLALKNDEALGAVGGGLILDGGTLQFAADFELNENRSLRLRLNSSAIDTNGFDVVLKQGIHSPSAEATLTKTGEGTLTMTGHNTYGGGTIIEQGAIIISNENNLGAPGGDLTFDGGELRLAADNIILTRAINVQGIGVIDTQGHTGSGVRGNITGDGHLTKTGDGSLLLFGSNTFSGTTEIEAGELRAGSAGAFSTVSLFEVNSGAVLDLDAFDQTIGGLSGGGTVKFAGQNLTIDQQDTDEEAIFSGNLNGAGGTLTKNGAGSLTLASALDSSINLVVNSGGHLGLKRDDDLTLQNELTGDGTLLIDLNDKELALDASQMGTNFNGTLALQNTQMDLDDGAAAVLADAGLKLSTGGEANLDQDRTIGGLVFDGGTLNVEDNLLSVTDLDVSNGGTIQADVSGIANNIDPNLNIFDFDANAPQMAVIKAANITGEAGNLKVQDKDGQPVIETSKEFQNGSGRRYFGVTTSEAGDGSDKGVYIGYGLTRIEANAGKVVELDSTGSDPASGRKLTAQLTGTGGFRFQGSEDVNVGNRESSYTGATTVDGLRVTAIADQALGHTSLLEIIDGGLFDLDGHRQTVGGLTGGDGGGIILGSSTGPNGQLTVNQSNDQTFSGRLTGNGDFIKEGLGTLVLNGPSDYSGTTTVRQGALVAGQADAFNQNSAWQVDGGLVDLNGFSLTVSQLAGHGGEIMLTDEAGLTVTQSADTGYRGKISGSGSLVKNGIGNLTLSGRNTYSGDTLLNSGTLTAGAAGALSAASVHQLNGYAELDLGGYDQTVAGLESRSVNTRVALSSGAALTVNSAADGTYDGRLTGDGSLVKNGQGQQILTNRNNTFSGGLQINEGSVKLTTAQAAGSGDLTVKTAAQLIVDNNSDETMVNNIKGQGTLVKSSAGKLALDGNVNLGTINVQGGLMSLAGTVAAEKFIIAQGAGVDTETLLLTGNRAMDLTGAAGDFNYRRMEVRGLDNLVLGELPSAADKDLHFVLPADVRHGDVMLKIDGQALNIAEARLSLEAGDYLRHLLGGDQIVLIDHTTGTIADSMGPYKAMYGATSYYFAVDSAGDKLALNYEGRSTDTSPAKSYLEAPLAALAMVSDHGRVSADLASRQIQGSTEQGAGVLLGVTGSHNRVKTGSHAEIDGVSVLVGPAWRFDNLSGTSRLGLFFEAGSGEYDAYNRYVGRRVKSSGDIDHAGGLVFGRHDFDGRYYVEASARLGRVQTDYKTRDLGTNASFDSSALYWGVHVGGGYLHAINEQSSVQPYLNVYFTRQNSDGVTTRAQERVRLETADSVTTRLGARYRHAINETVTAQVGAAWDQELDGEQKGTIDGAGIDSPSMKGASAFGEIGLSIKPQDAPYFVELNAFGNAGKRDGGGGQASVGFNF